MQSFSRCILLTVSGQHGARLNCGFLSLGPQMDALGATPSETLPNTLINPERFDPD
jgi:hypothetical protein